MTVWLSYRGRLTDFFSDPKIRGDFLNFWNEQKDCPKINTYFSDAGSFISYFETRLGLRPKLIELMYRQHYIPPFGVAGLNEIGQEAARCLGTNFTPLEKVEVVLRMCQNCSSENITSSLDCDGGHVYAYCNNCAQQVLSGTEKCATCQRSITKVTILRFV